MKRGTERSAQSPLSFPEVCFRRIERRPAVGFRYQGGFSLRLLDVFTEEFVEDLPAHLLGQVCDGLQLPVPGFIARFGDDLRYRALVREPAAAFPFNHLKAGEGCTFDRFLQGVSFQIVRPAGQMIQPRQDLRDLFRAQRRGRSEVILRQALVVFSPLPAGGLFAVSNGHCFFFVKRHKYVTIDWYKLNRR